MNRNRQQGMVLVISLLLMVVLTLFVISSTRLTTGNMRIVGNMQAKKLVEATAQRGIEEVLSGISAFYAPTLTITPSGVPSGMTAQVSDRVCIRSTPAPGYSAVSGISPEDTFWNVGITVTDTITGSNTVLNQGVRIRLPAGNCPA